MMHLSDLSAESFLRIMILRKMYFDSFLKISCLEGSDITEAIKALEAISAKFGVDFVLSVSADATELSDEVKSHIIVSL